MNYIIKKEGSHAPLLLKKKMIYCKKTIKAGKK